MQMTRRLMLAAGAAAAAASPALATPPLKPDLRTRALAMMAEAKIPAAGIAVIKDGAVLACEGLGLASLPFQVPANDRTLFHLGSVSKQFTAALVLEQVRAGKLRLDDPLGKHCRDLPDAFAAARVDHLLSHMSGIADYEGLPGFEPDRTIDRAMFLKGAATLPAEFAGGEAWSYSNTGYVLLGFLLNDLTGRSYRDLVTDSLLKPLGAREGRLDDATAIIAGRAEPYVLVEDGVRRATQMDSAFSGWPDGGVLMSPRDMALWEIGLQQGSPIPSASFSRMTTPAVLNSGRGAAYGMGWFTDRLRGEPIQYHSGSVPGFLTFYYRAPAQRLGVVVMTNIESGPARRFMRDLTLELAEAAAPGSTPLSLDVLADRSAGKTAEAMAILRRGKSPLDPSRFTPELSGRLSGSGAPPNIGTDGTPTLSLVEQFDEPGGTVRRYRLARGGKAVHIDFAYATNGRIYRIRLL